ncbi:MAG: cyclase family protein [Tepidanaerobacteraceae bacterium]
MAKKIIDLSQEIYQGMSVYPGHVKTLIWEHHTHQETLKTIGTGFSYATRGLLLSDHGPTHVDALNHIDPREDAESIDQLPLELFYTEGVCLDVSFVKPLEYITKKDLEVALEKSGQEIKRGDTVLLYTGHYDRTFGTEDWLFKYAGLDREATEWLADKGVVNIGVDAPSIDTPKDKSYPSHTVCKERRLLNIENLANLDKITNKRFEFIGLPLKIRDGTGSPIRAVAVLDE